MLAGAAVALALAALALAAQPGDAAGVVLDNGVAQLGVRPMGDLGVDLPVAEGGAYSPGGTCRSPGTGGSCGTTVVGLRDKLTQMEGITDSCVCEGWGLSYRAPGSATATVGWAQSGTAPYKAGIIPIAFTGSPTGGVIVQGLVGDLRITHDFQESALPNVFEARVTIENIGASRLSDIRYRRVVDFDAEPSPQNEVVTITPTFGPFPLELMCFRADPFTYADPTTAYGILAPPGPGTSCGGTGGTVGPGDLGAMLEVRPRRYISPLAMGVLDPGEKARFKLYYGVQQAPGALGADFDNLNVEVYATAVAQIPDMTGSGSASAPSPVMEYGFGYSNDPCAPPDPACTPCTTPPPPPCPYPTGPVCGVTYPSGPCPPNALFSHSQVAPTCDPTPVVFTDLSTGHSAYPGIASRYWEFGDGDTSGDTNPTHMYAKPGTYVVTLTVTGTNGEKDVHSMVVTVLGPGDCSGSADSSDPGGKPKPPRSSRGTGDLDGDLVLDGDDNCPLDVNPTQADLDGDQVGDACDPDIDGDGHLNAADNCRVHFNPGQGNVDHDLMGDLCDDDIDGDGLLNGLDNCRYIPNPLQENTDGDTDGDACDPDLDGDGILNHLDCFPQDPLRDCRHRSGVAYQLDVSRERDFNGVTPPDGRLLGLTPAGWALVFTTATLMLFLVLLMARRRRDDEGQA